MRLTRGRFVASLLFVFSTVAFLYFVLPKLLGWFDPNLRFNAGILIVLAMVVVVYWLLFRTTLGFEFRAAFSDGFDKLPGHARHLELRSRCPDGG